MSRLVQPRRRVAPGSSGDRRERAPGEAIGVVDGGESYMDRIAKYIPGEIIAAYMTLDHSLVGRPVELAQAQREGKLNQQLAKLAEQDWVAAHLTYLPQLVFFVAVLAVPLYFWQLSRLSADRPPWTLHAVISTIAFALWAYAVQGSWFVIYNYYDGRLASALVVVFMLFSGLFEPSSRAPTPIGDTAPPDRAARSTQPRQATTMPPSNL